MESVIPNVGISLSFDELNVLMAVIDEYELDRTVLLALMVAFNYGRIRGKAGC